MRQLLCGALFLMGCFNWESLSVRFGADGSPGDDTDGMSTPADLAGADLAGVDVPRPPAVQERPANSIALHAIRGTDTASVVYAVGNAGTILRYNQGTWSSVPSGGMNILRDVWVLATETVVVGDGPTALVDKGAGFMSETGNLNKNPVASWATMEGGLVAIGDGAGGGKAWVKQPVGWTEYDRMTGEFMYGLWGTQKTFFAVGANSAALHISSDALGRMFTSQKRDLSPGGTTFRAVWGTAADNVWAVGDGGAIDRWDGVAWTRVPPAALPTMTLRGIWGSSASNIYAVGDAGTVLHYDGSRWSRANLSVSTIGNLHDIWGAADGSRFWIVTSLGEIFRSP